MKKNISKIMNERRTFLKQISKAGLSLAACQSGVFTTGMMLSRAAAAQNASGIRRVVCVYIPDGAPFLNGQSLFNPASDMTLPVASAPLESVKQHCVFFNNALVSSASGAEAGGHGNCSKSFGGLGNRNSYDVELERTLGENSPFPSILLGVQSNDGNHGYATKKDGREITYQDNPSAAFNRLFNADVAVGSIGTKRSQAVLDINRAEIQALNQKLGVAERERLEEHLAAIEKIEARLQAQAENEAITGCVNPEWNADNFIYDANDKTTFTRVSDLQMDTAVLALRCNLTKVVSIMLGNHQAEHAVPELNFSGSYHQSIHGGTVETFSETRAYLSSRLAALISKLENTLDEFGEPLIHSTLVLQLTDMADGNAHDSENAPMMLAGGGAAIRGGNVVNCGSHMNIFDTATEALGLTGAVPQFGNGALSGVIA